MDKSKDKWWDEECREVEALDASGRSDLFYSKVKELTGQRKKCHVNYAVKDKSGNLLTETAKIRERWKEYIEELYDKNGKP